jgi:hypothetical protein
MRDKDGRESDRIRGSGSLDSRVGAAQGEGIGIAKTS